MQFIVTPEALREAVQEMAKNDVLAIDLECENNLHHYGTYISLIQVSGKGHDWIIDVLELKKINPLIEILHNPNIKKIFHDVSFDLRILHLEFNCRPKNIFDTQIAALLLGKKELGLGSLLKEYYDVEKEAKYQMADWTTRPLDKEMLSYATKDTKYLLPLYYDLKKELEALARWDWTLQECLYLEESEMTYKENVFTDFKGYKFLSKKKQAILKNLFELREELAKKVDMPNYYVMSNKKIKELLEKPPSKLDEWRRMKGVHPTVKKHAKKFMEAMNEYDINTLPKQVFHPKYTPEQKEKVHELGLIAQDTADKLGIRKHLVINKDQIQDIVLYNRFDSLRDWQKELLGF